MTTWRDIVKGDAVELGGKLFTVSRIKGKKKRRTVTVTGPGGAFTSEVKADEKVKRAKLHSREGAQRRWASEAERAEAERLPLVTPGNPSQTKPPHKAKGSGWTDYADKVERELMRDGAELIAETDDEAAGWYVPPPQLDTIYAHMHVMHGATIFDGEVAALAAHDEEHRLAAEGRLELTVQHWHTKRRP